MKSWQPPVLLLVVMGAAVVGFALGGPGLGMTIAGLSLVGLVVVALRAVPGDPIGRHPHPESARRILIVSTEPIVDGSVVEMLADAIGLGGVVEEAEIRILTPARPDFLDRWATDLKKARERAQLDLVISVATLALSGVEAGARVGDQDITQAIEDELADFDATEVFLVTSESGTAVDRAAGELASRLSPPLRVIRIPPPRKGEDPH